MAGPVLELLKAADWPTWPKPTYLSMLIPADSGPAWPGLSQHLIFLPQPELWQQFPHLHIVAPPNSLCQLCWDRRDSCMPRDGRASAGAAEGIRLANLADTDISLDVDPSGSEWGCRPSMQGIAPNRCSPGIISNPTMVQ